MKILYSAGNRVGADSQLFRFLKKCDHEIKIAAYVKSSESLYHIDWTLDALYHNYSKVDREKLFDLFKSNNIPRVGMKEIELLVEEIADFSPDLIICDYEPILATIATAMGIELWYCSPVHLLDGIKWKYGQLKYNGLLENTRKNLSRLPKANKTFVYSIFGDMVNAPELKYGYEWIRPYHIDATSSNNDIGVAVIPDSGRISELSKILNCIPPFCFTLFGHSTYNLSHLESINLSSINTYSKVLSNCRWMLSTGETSFLADAFYNKINKVCLAPNLNDQEALLNAILCEYYKFGDDVAQVEYLEQYSVEKLANSFNESNDRMYELSNTNIGYLHEKLESI